MSQEQYQLLKKSLPIRDEPRITTCRLTYGATGSKMALALSTERYTDCVVLT